MIERQNGSVSETRLPPGHVRGGKRRAMTHSLISFAWRPLLLLSIGHPHERLLRLHPVFELLWTRSLKIG